MVRVAILPENSAQGMTAPLNPFVERLILHLKSSLPTNRGLWSLRVADQGCGKLRHLKTLRKHFRTALLVDTNFQIKRTQNLGGRWTSLEEYVGQNRGSNRLLVVDRKTFGRLRLGLDVILCCCVFDVVPPESRRQIIRSAVRNLRRGGCYWIIIPRNDQSITCRCKRKNSYSDGHIFRRNGFCTFYANYAEGSGSLLRLQRQLRAAGLRVEVDLSVHRQVCLALRKL